MTRSEAIHTSIPFILILLLFFSPMLSRAEIVTYTHTVRQLFSGSQSPDDARIAALAKAKREVLEKAGTYLDSVKVVKDHQLVENQIHALSSALLQAEIVSQKNYMNGGIFGIEIEAKVCIDTSTLEDRVKKFLHDRTALEKAERLEKRERELLARIRELEQQNTRLTAEEEKPEQRHELQKERAQEFGSAAGNLSAVEAHRKALSLWDGAKYTDSARACAYLDEAIRKDGQFADAFNNRGIAHAELGQWKKAIKDYDRAIQLDADFSDAYNNRATAFAVLGEPIKAKTDYDEAIRKNTKNARAYYNRGTFYENQGRYGEAIEDFNRTLALDPREAAAFYNRGIAYVGMNDVQNGLSDFDRAISIDPDNAAFLYNRGMAFVTMGRYQDALRDFSKAIQLDPKEPSAYFQRGITRFKMELYQEAIDDFNQVITRRQRDAGAYKYRGLSHLMTGDRAKLCPDLATACSLGDCKALEQLKRDGHCR